VERRVQFGLFLTAFTVLMHILLCQPGA
jgi:hypothetical protein